MDYNIIESISGGFNWLLKQIMFDCDWSQTYFWMLTIVSVIVWGLELIFPWRKNQKAIRRNFWLDAVYMDFNFFLFSSVIYGVYG
jgi:hypothetical protein